MASLFTVPLLVESFDGNFVEVVSVEKIRNSSTENVVAAPASEAIDNAASGDSSRGVVGEIGVDVNGGGVRGGSALEGIVRGVEFEVRDNGGAFAVVPLALAVPTDLWLLLSSPRRDPGAWAALLLVTEVRLRFLRWRRSERFLRGCPALGGARGSTFNGMSGLGWCPS
jgi:hypothetical protein